MKRLNYMVLLVIIITGMSCGTSQNSATAEQEKLALKTLIDGGDYKIEATMAYPRRGRSVSLTSSYSLQVRNDSVISYLPFYGRAYTIPYGGGQGLNFNAPITDYTVKYNRKGTAEVSFTARTSEDQYNFKLDIYPNGSSNIDVVMQQRESMRYSGRLEKELR